MDALLTIAFPDLDQSDQEYWEAYKNLHSSASRSSVGLHFTLAFANSKVAETLYCAHIAAVATATPRVEFVCNYAMLGADDEDDRAYVFLVPDEGYASISLLHDRVYTGPLESFLRLDLPYVPHITVATLNDRKLAKKLCDELNHQGVCLKGSLTKASVGHIRDGLFSTRSEYTLAGSHKS
jgi:2'-5' RNA ligase